MELISYFFHPAAVFTIGAVVMGAALNPWMLLIGRIIVGFGIGIAAMAVPMYIAELAPAEMRGRLVVVNNMFITGGQFVATVIDGAFSYLGINVGWRSVTHVYTNILGKHPCVRRSLIRSCTVDCVGIVYTSCGVYPGQYIIGH